MSKTSKVRRLQRQLVETRAQLVGMTGSRDTALQTAKTCKHLYHDAKGSLDEVLLKWDQIQYVLSTELGREAVLAQLGGVETPRTNNAGAYFYNYPLMLRDKPTSYPESKKEALLSVKAQRLEKLCVMARQSPDSQRIKLEVDIAEGQRMAVQYLDHDTLHKVHCKEHFIDALAKNFANLLLGETK